MLETVLITGATSKTYEAIASAAKSAGFKTAVADTENAKNTIQWNKASPISARAVVLQAENLLGKIGTTILYFDAVNYDESFGKLSVENISRGIDSMTLGYMYLAQELISRFSQENEGNLVFMINKSEQREYGVLPSAAIAACEAFAERTANFYAGKNGGVILVKNNDTSIEETADWLFQYLAQPGAQKNAYNPKAASKWLKPGAKPAPSIPLFGR